MPSSVSIFSVTKFLPGEVMFTVAFVIFIATLAPGLRISIGRRSHPLPCSLLPTPYSLATDSPRSPETLHPPQSPVRSQTKPPLRPRRLPRSEERRVGTERRT